MECDVFYCAWFCDKCKWRDRQSVVKTVSPGDVVLPMNSMPSSSAAPFKSRKHVERRESEEKRQRERQRESKGHISYNVVEPSSYLEFTLRSHTCCSWTIKLGLTWLSLPCGPGNEASQPAMLGVLFCTL